MTARGARATGRGDGAARSAAPDASAGVAGGARLAAAGLGLIVLLAAARSVVAYAPRLVFDVDPAVDPEPIAAIGPGASLLLDAGLLAAAALAFLGMRRARCAAGGEARGRRRRTIVLLVLAALPLPALAGHAAHDVLQLARAAQWTAAIVAGLAVWEVARAHPAWRRTAAVLLLVAALLPFARGALQSEVAGRTGPEHARTVAAFERERDEVLAARGWEPGSANARIFERRLRQAQPTGWFETTNVLASLAGAALVAGAGVAAGLRRIPRRRAAMVAAIGLALAGGAMLALSGSKGAWAATLAAAGALVFATRAPSARTARLLPWACGLGPVCVLALVAVRGGLLPEDVAGGERSVLFRWHYQVGAAGAIAEAPLAGTGPEGFQSAYLRHRPERSPEEPASPHAAWLDWTAAAGAGGLGWVALSIVAAIAVGRGMAVRRDAGDRASGAAGGDGIGRADASEAARRLRVPILGGAALLLALVVHTDGPALPPEDLVARVFGAALAGGAGWLLVRGVLAAGADRRAAALVDAGIGAAALLLLLHGQLEMTPTRPGSAAWTAVLVALAAAGGSRGTDDRSTAAGAAATAGDAARPHASGAAAGAGLAALAALVMLALGVLVVGAQRTRIAAAAELAGVAEVRDALRVLALPRSAARDEAMTAARDTLRAFGVDGLTAAELADRLDAAERDARAAAAASLASIRMPVPDARSAVDAAVQHRAIAGRLAGDGRPAEAIDALDRARDLLAPVARSRPRDARTLAELAALERQAAPILVDAGRPDDAVAARGRAHALAERIARLDPRGLASWTLVADAAAAAGDAERAAEAARIALERDAAFALDPLKQLPDGERGRLEALAATAGRPGGDG